MAKQPPGRFDHAKGMGCTCAIDYLDNVIEKDDPDCPFHHPKDREQTIQELTDTNNWQCVCICGSMRFFSWMLEVAAKLTAEGFVVLMPFSVKEGTDDIMLDAMHRTKINMADSIVVVTNFQNYIGESTKAEIDYAIDCAKNIRFERFPGTLPDKPKYQELMGA